MLSTVELQPHTSSIGFEPIKYPYAYTTALDAADFTNSSNYLASGSTRLEQVSCEFGVRYASHYTNYL